MAKAPRKDSRLRRIARFHWKLFTAAAIGIAATLALLLVTDWRSATAALVGWDVGVACYLVFAAVTLARFDLQRIRQLANVEDEGGTAILILTVVAAAASFAAIISQLGSMSGGADKGLFFAHAVLTITLSWTLIHAIFAFHYAHDYYGSGRSGRRGEGLVFPQDDKPDYWDFVYFSFVIGMTFQVSDVQVTSKSVRRLVVAHGLVSFVFNVAILAVTVNIGGNLIGQPS